MILVVLLLYIGGALAFWAGLNAENLKEGSTEEIINPSVVVVSPSPLVSPSPSLSPSPLEKKQILSSPKPKKVIEASISPSPSPSISPSLSPSPSPDESSPSPSPSPSSQPSISPGVSSTSSPSSD